MKIKKMGKKTDILSKAERRSGMTVPSGYFADFAEQLKQDLPQRELHFDNAPKPTTWIRVRPYVYLAAMIAGVWCMLRLFNLIMPMTDNYEVEFTNNQILAQAVENESFVEEYCFDDVNEYDLLQDLYENGFDTGNLETPNDN